MPSRPWCVVPPGHKAPGMRGGVGGTQLPSHPPIPPLYDPQDTMDETLPDTLHMTGIYLMILMTSLAIVTVSIHYYAVMAAALFLSFAMMQVGCARLASRPFRPTQRVDVPAPPLDALYVCLRTCEGRTVLAATRPVPRPGHLQYLYLPAATVLKRWAGETAGGVYVHVDESLQGMDVIRAFGAVDYFIQVPGRQHGLGPGSADTRNRGRRRRCCSAGMDF